jgi:hypothetical protein
VRARAVDEAASRLRSLREEGRGCLGLAALALGLAVAATKCGRRSCSRSSSVDLSWGVRHPSPLAPLGSRRAAVRREREAYVIPEIQAFASREVTMDRRQTFRR